MDDCCLIDVIIVDNQKNIENSNLNRNDINRNYKNLANNIQNSTSNIEEKIKNKNKCYRVWSLIKL